MARLHQFKKLEKPKFDSLSTYMILDNESWESEKILTFKEFVNVVISLTEKQLKKDPIKTANFYKLPNDLKVPPIQCESAEPLNIAYDNSDIYFWIDNKWKKSSLLDR